MGDSPFSRIVIPSAVEGSLRRSGILHAGGHVKIAWIIGFTLSCRLRFTGVQGRFLGFARNDDTGKAVFSFRSLPHGEKDFGLLPPSSGRRCPEGAEVGSRSGMK